MRKRCVIFYLQGMMLLTFNLPDGNVYGIF